VGSLAWASNPAIMERVIANLIANALRYAPDGSAVLPIARARGDQVELCVVDHGPGVPGPARQSSPAASLTQSGREEAA
jgi:K+-sensing histidine kinase KdpD